MRSSRSSEPFSALRAETPRKPPPRVHCGWLCCPEGEADLTMSLAPGLWSVRDGETGVDEGPVLEGVDDRGGVVADRDAAFPVVLRDRRVASLAPVTTRLLP